MLPTKIEKITPGVYDYFYFLDPTKFYDFFVEGDHVIRCLTDVSSYTIRTYNNTQDYPQNVESLESGSVSEAKTSIVQSQVNGNKWSISWDRVPYATQYVVELYNTDTSTWDFVTNIRDTNLYMYTYNYPLSYLYPFDSTVRVCATSGSGDTIGYTYWDISLTPISPTPIISTSYDSSNNTIVFDLLPYPNNTVQSTTPII